MKLPVQAKPVARAMSRARIKSRMQPSGCCLQVCTPLGCHCAAESPFC
jgi:hypothetical protein